jgi:hypothetical protein
MVPNERYDLPSESETKAWEDGMRARSGSLCPATGRSRSLACAAAATVVALFFGSAAWAANAPALRLIKIIPINGTAASPNTRMFSFDISWWDPVTQLYFLADRSNAALDVVDTKTDTLFGQIGGPAPNGAGFAGDTGSTNTSGPNGVTVSPNPNVPCIFATDGPSRVVSFNYKVSFTAVVSSMNTGGKNRADELAFDPRDNLLLTINNADTPPFGSLFSVSSTCVLGPPKQVPLTAVNPTNGAEQPVWNPMTQRFYVSIPEVNGSGPHGGVAQINTNGVIDNFFPINFVSPAGLTLGPNGDLLVGGNLTFDTSGNPCTNVVTSATSPVFTLPNCPGIAFPQVAICNPGRGCTGNALVSVPGVGDGDEVWFNPGDGNYYVTAGNHPIAPVLGVVASGANTPPNTLTQLVPTLYAQPPVGATATHNFVHSQGTVHSVAASAVNNHVYVPLPANTAYNLNGVNCAQGCIGVFSAQ